MAKKPIQTSKAQKQRQQMILVGGAVAAAIVLAVAIIILVQSSSNLEVCNATDASCYSEYAGIEQGVTDEGIPYIGSADAPIIITEFSDFSCPHCAEFAPIAERVINEYVRNGEARWEYRPVTIIGASYSNAAARAALCAGEQDAFWPFHQEIFELQRAESRSAFETSRFVTIASDMGLNGGDLRTCMNSGRPRGVISLAEAQGSRLGITGTPAVYYSLDGGENWESINADYNAIASVIQQVNS